MYSKPMEEYYTTKQIAKLLDIKMITVRRWILLGKLKAFNLGKSYRILKVDFEKFMKLRKVKI